MVAVNLSLVIFRNAFMHDANCGREAELGRNKASVNKASISLAFIRMIRF